MGLIPRKPGSADAEVEQVDASLRVQCFRLRNAKLTDAQRSTLESVVNGLLDHRYRVAPIHHPCQAERDAAALAELEQS